MKKSIWGDMPVRTVAGREIPESILLENGVIFTERELKEYDAKRCFLPETVLRKMAGEMAETITIHTYKDGRCSEDFTRNTTEAEKAVLYKLALSALLGLNHGETARQSKAAEDAIINAIEYTLILMLPSANSYDSLYLKLRRSVAFWREHTEAEIMAHYGEAEKWAF